MSVATFPRLMTTAEVARALRVSTATVYRRVEDGTIRAIRTTTTAPLRFREDEVLAL